MKDAKDISDKSKFGLSGKTKRTFACCSFILLIILMLGAAVGALTVSGYTKKWVCDVVVEDSTIWDKAKVPK
jgi:hypothetical protein